MFVFDGWPVAKISPASSLETQTELLSRQLLEKNINLNIWFNHYVPTDGKTFYTPIGNNEIVSPDC